MVRLKSYIVLYTNNNYCQTTKKKGKNEKKINFLANIDLVIFNIHVSTDYIKVSRLVFILYQLSCDQQQSHEQCPLSPLKYYTARSIN